MQRITDLVEMVVIVLPLLLAMALFLFPVAYFLYAVIVRLTS